MLIGMALDASVEVAYWTAMRTAAGMATTVGYLARWAFVKSRPREALPRVTADHDAGAARCIRAAALLHRRGALTDKGLIDAVRSVVRGPVVRDLDPDEYDKVPTNALPASAHPVAALPASAHPAAALPASAHPVAALPASAHPVAALPASAHPVAALPASAPPAYAPLDTAPQKRAI